LRREQLQGDGSLERLRLRQLGEPLSQRAIADLVMILQKKYKTVRRQIAARRSPRLAVAIGRR
jgi:hypothetical protein